MKLGIKHFLGRRALKKILAMVLLWGGTSFLLLIVFSLGIFVYFAKDLPRPEKFTERSFVESTKIYDRTGNTLLYELYGEEKREVISLSEIPEHLKQAVIATEDAKFYSHHGLDFGGIFRSVLINLELREAAVGGSTISQQLIRSTFLTLEKTLKRKVREVILTLELERRYSKDQILEWYLNQIPFGPNLYGVQSASKAFFGKPASKLTRGESAVLAALIQAPSYLSPRGSHGQELLDRKDYVISRMVIEGYLSKEEGGNLQQEEIVFSEPEDAIRAPHFVFYVLDYLFEKYGKEFLQEGGFRIYTSLDWDLQRYGETTIRDGVKAVAYLNIRNAALVVSDPKTGEILSLIGSADWYADPYPEGCNPGVTCLFDPKVNVATYRIGRQPGSSFKPFVYVTAFEKGYLDNYVLTDELTNFGIYAGKPYIPGNYDGRFRGPVTLRESLAQSLNIPSIKLLLGVGLENAIATAQKLGITTIKDPSLYGPSLVLGGGEVKLLDMVSAYGAFAQDGMKTAPVSVLKIIDSNGNIVEENHKTPRRVLNSQAVRTLNSILSDNDARIPAFGPHSVLYFPDYQVAVKTGTTTDFKDGWVIGYTPSIVVGIWAGNSNGQAMAREPAISLTGPMWRKIMEYLLPKLPKENFAPPPENTPPPS